jgi:hypothetical protein
VLGAALALALVAATAQAQTPVAPPVVGSWNLVVTGPAGAYPTWLEISRSGRDRLIGRVMHGTGSARPIARVDFADGALRFTVPPQWERDTAELRVEGRLEGERMTGTLVTPGGERHTWTATRAPALAGAATPAWGAPVALFNGRDLAGWEPRGGENRWRVVNGVLAATGGGANLVTTRTFTDFKLRVEFRYPPGSNSGVYLRGRYEVQIEDPAGKAELGNLDIGGVYGVLSPNQNAARAPGQWQAYDITLVGRRLTVVLNGRTVICDQLIPGPTGGALDGDEAAPGPIYLQGDHGPVEFRRITLTPRR